MKNILFAIGEVLIDFIPIETDCNFSDVKLFSPLFCFTLTRTSDSLYCGENAGMTTLAAGGAKGEIIVLKIDPVEKI